MNGTTAYDGACECGGLIEMTQQGSGRRVNRYMCDLTTPEARRMRRIHALALHHLKHLSCCVSMNQAIAHVTRQGLDIYNTPRTRWPNKKEGRV